MTVQKVIMQNVSRPDFWLLNLNPATAEKTSNTDFTAVIVSWAMILVPLIIIGVIIFGR